MLSFFRALSAVLLLWGGACLQAEPPAPKADHQAEPAAEARKRRELAEGAVKNGTPRALYKQIGERDRKNDCLFIHAEMTELLDLEKKAAKDKTPADEVKEVELTMKLNFYFISLQLDRLNDEIEKLKSAPISPDKAWLKDANKSLIKLKTASKEKITAALDKLLTKPGEVPLFRDLFTIHQYADRKSDFEPTEAERKAAELAASGPNGSGGSYSKSKAGGSFSKAGAGGFSGSGFEGGGYDRGILLEPTPRIDLSKLVLIPARPEWTWCSSVEKAEQHWGELLKASPQRAAEMDEFLKAAGVDLTKPIDPKRAMDLSARFNAPRSQGETKACVAFAATSDLETFANVPPLSAGLAYAYMVADNIEGQPPITDDLRADFARKGGVDPKSVSTALDQGAVTIDESLTRLKQNAVAPEAAFPFAPKDFIPESVNAIQDRKYGVGKWVSSEKPPTAAALVRLIQAGKPPMVTIKSDARDVVEDWIKPKPGTIGHIINVVGYGTAVDPFDGRAKPYFLVRDSFAGDHGIHYRMSADALLADARSVHKITEAKVLTPGEITTYPKSK